MKTTMTTNTMTIKTMLLFAAAALSLLLLTQCNTQASPQPKTGTLIVYRTWHLQSGAWSLPFYLNGTLVAKLTNGCYYKLDLPEGDYVLTHPPGHMDPQKIHVTAGQTLYFCNSITMITYVFEVTEDQNEARQIVSHLRQQTTQR